MDDIDVVDGNCIGKRSKGKTTDVDQPGAQNNRGTSHCQQTGVNKMVTSPIIHRKGSHYPMDHKYRGKALIFNHKDFKVPGIIKPLKPRSGTDIDCNNISFTLNELGFKVAVYQDLDFREIKATVNEAANQDYSDYDCFAIIVLSHGDLGKLYAHNMDYTLDELLDPFVAERCLTLANKPKLFFIQACQGVSLDAGVTMLSMRTQTDGHPVETYRIPSHPDFLVCYSTVPGYFAWRNPHKGSYYIQALCEELREHAYVYDIMTLLTFVNQRVAIDFESNTPDTPHMHQQKQMPCITSMLTRLLLFTKKE